MSDATNCNISNGATPALESLQSKEDSNSRSDMFEFKDTNESAVEKGQEDPHADSLVSLNSNMPERELESSLLLNNDSKSDVAPFEMPQLDGDSKLEYDKVGDLGEEDKMLSDDKSLGSFLEGVPNDSFDDILDLKTCEDNEYKSSGETEQLAFCDAPSEGLNDLMNTYKFEGDEKAEDSIHDKKSKPSTLRKKTGAGTGRDKKSSVAAKKREITKFKTHFDPFMATLSKERLPTEWPSEDDHFKSYLTNKIEQDTDMDENAKERLKYVLKNSSSKMKQVQVCWMIAKCFGKVPRGGGGYKPNTDCPVCKVAENKLVDLTDHICKYCRSCYDESGWKQDYILRVSCSCKKDDDLGEV